MRGDRSRLLWVSRYYTNLVAFVRRYKFSGSWSPRWANCRCSHSQR